MGYESSKAKRQLLGANVPRARHRFSAADIKLKDTKAASEHPPIGTTTTLTTKRQLQDHALAPTQKTRLMIAKASELKGRKAVTQAGATKAGHQAGQDSAVNSSNFKANQNLTPITGRNFEASAAYIIKSSPGKGLGMFASRNIRKGTRILAEKPFFSLVERPVVSLSDPYAPNDITEAFDRLLISEKYQYMSLHCPQRPDCSLIFSIYEANCFEMGSGTCICLDASRINHSCIPNAHYSWNTNIERETVHAVKDIFKGEEITISYCSALRSLEDRERELQPYVFTCRCPACQTDTDFGAISQIRRLRMLDLDSEIADYQNDPPAARAEYGERDERSAILRLIKLLDEEGLVFEKSLAYHDAAQCALKRGWRERALEYADKELDLDLCCAGKDSPSYNETVAFFLKIYFGGEDDLD